MVAVREALKATVSVHNKKPHLVPLQQSFVSIYVLFHHFSILGLIIMGAYICENHPPFHKMERQDFDEDSFCFVIIVMLAIGTLTWTKNDEFMKIKYGLPDHSEDIDMADDESDTTSLGASSYGTSMASSYTNSLPSQASSKVSLMGSFEDINMQRDSGAKRRGVSGNSIGSTELVSLLERDGDGTRHKNRNGDVCVKSLPAEDDDALSMMTGSTRNGGGASTRSQDASATEELFEDIITGDNDSRDIENRELFEHHMIGVPTFCPEPDNDLLNIHQSLELKGILTLCYLIYQSTNAGSAFEHQHHGYGRDADQGEIFNQYHNLSKVGESAFLFMTGFGHAMYFHRQKDYSIRRVLKVIFRINFTTLFLCLALDKPYIFYKPCAMHTYFFFLVYWTMRWRRGKNYTKFGLRLKLAVVALSIYLVWDCPIGLWPVHAIFFGRSRKPIAGAPYGQLWEFYFQGHLHHWAAFIGMMFSINHAVTSLTLRRLEKLGKSAELVFKGIIACTITIALCLWFIGPFHAKKYMYNAINAYFGFLPLLWYIFMRNATANLRGHHCQMFKAIGYYSLEIYLLHHHIFLSDESGSKLVITPGYPSCNTLLILGMLGIISKALKAATSVLISMFMSSSSDKYAIWNSVALCSCISGLYALAAILDIIGLSVPYIVGAATIICGTLLYQAIIDITAARDRSRDKGRGSKRTWHKNNLCVAKGIPGVVATLAIAVLFVIWHLASTRGVANTMAPLGGICGEVANQGAWSKVPVCSEFQKGLNGRDFHSRTIGKSCEDVYQWGWTLNEHNSRCRFRFHEAIDSQTKLQQKHVLFMGDTITRNLFFAFCRSLGDVAARKYDAELPLHSEITKSFGETIISFQWAPLTNDVVEKLKGIKPETDLVIAGSGVLDKLHLWATDADKNSYELTLKQLAKDLQFLKENSAPVVWVKPTAVNTKALPNQEKRTQMSEIKIQEIRQMHDDLGINAAAAFVLDGLSLTKDQTERSFDGIHYPPQIYDVGAQILMNSLDWLVPTTERLYPINEFKPNPGSMANPALGLMVLCCLIIGLLFFDGYLGFSYLASALMQPRTSPASKRFTEFYTSSKQEQSKYSFAPQDVYDDICQAYKKESNERRDKIPKTEQPRTRRDANSTSSKNTSDSNNLQKDDGFSVSSKRTFGLETINED